MMTKTSRARDAPICAEVGGAEKKDGDGSQSQGVKLSQSGQVL